MGGGRNGKKGKSDKYCIKCNNDYIHDNAGDKIGYSCRWQITNSNVVRDSTNYAPMRQIGKRK